LLLPTNGCRLSIFDSSFAHPGSPPKLGPVNLSWLPAVQPLIPCSDAPFQFIAVQAETVHLLIKIVGKGSRLLSELQPKAVVDLLGPLGRGFRFQAERIGCLVGGGVGMAPLLFLVEYANHQFQQHAPLHVFLGGQTGDDLRQLGREFQELGCRVSLATDDGTLGHHGLVTEPLAQEIKAMHIAYACGPMPMTAAIVALCKEARIACQVSLESHMACGLGACLGCAVHGADGHYRHVCKHGPVFSAEEVAWLR
jgi:dihydroorotate dehydrogenase electron transfer subunit